MSMDGYFYGWYFKCQSEKQTIAVIPAVHGAGRERTCSIQFITEEQAWTVPFSFSGFEQRKNDIVIDRNHFGSKGIYLDISTSEIRVQGSLRFSKHTPIKYDIMGPFAWVPFMECRHSVYSMQHSVNGKIYINGKAYVFENAIGYWEGDSGRSFPKEYAWTQSFLPKGSIMLSVADIPLAGFHFTGVIGIIRWKEKEYRFATYLGARVVQKGKDRILIRQGAMELEVRFLEVSARILEEPPHDVGEVSHLKASALDVDNSAHMLQAPTNGNMIRTIKEHVRGRAFYRFRIKGQTVFALQTDKASFEYEY